MKVLRTPNLSRIERYQGVVGKRMGEWVYVHRNYIDKLPAELVALVWNFKRIGNPEYWATVRAENGDPCPLCQVGTLEKVTSTTRENTVDCRCVDGDPNCGRTCSITTCT